MLMELISIGLVAIVGFVIGYLFGLKRGFLVGIRTFRTSIQEGHWSREEIDDLVRSIINDWRGPHGERYCGPVTYGWQNHDN